MYPKNAVSPEPIAIGAVVQISDGAVQTSGVTVRIKPIGVAEGDGAGTTAYSTDGVVLYTPTQAETNYTSFVLIAKKTGCIPVAITVVTTSSVTPGTVLLAPVTHTSAVVPTVTTLTGHTAQTGDVFALANGAAGFAAIDNVVDAIKAKTDNLPTDPADQSAVEAAITAATGPLATAGNLATVAGYLDTEIAAILADTNELQLDWQNGGRLDLILDARASQTSVDTIDDLLDTEIPALTTAVADLPTNAELATAITTALTTALTEGYRATNATGSVRDLLYEILQSISEFTISGTTKTVKKIDGSTTAKTYTLNDGTTPTGITETT